MASIQAYGITETATEATGEGSFTFRTHGVGKATFNLDGHFTTKVLITTPTGVSGPNTVRVYFDRPMKKNAALIDPTNYTITPDTVDGINVNVVSVTPQDVDEPNYVDLTVSEFTNGELYSMDVNGPVDPESIPMDPLQANYSLLGQGKTPTVSSLVASSLYSFEITFSETMYENSFIKDPTNYSFDKGLQVLAVKYQDNKVVLTTSEQTPGELYTLTISSQP